MTTTDFADHCSQAWPASTGYEVISRHLTSTGVVSYTRCACGRVQIRIQPFAAAQVITHPDQRFGDVRRRVGECGRSRESAG